MLKRVLRKLSIIVLFGLTLLYAGDYLVLRYRTHRGAGVDSVTVYRYYSVAKKANRVEYDYIDTEQQNCARSLFPHMGYSPCWYLRRHTQQIIEI